MQRIGNCSKRFSNLLFRSFHSSPKFLEIEKKDISSSSSSSFSSSSSSSSSSSLPKVFVLFGATGTGKTTLAVELAKRIGGEIVSCDSVQIYKGLSIGSNVATKEELQDIPTHMVQEVELGTPFNVSDYVLSARDSIHQIASRGKVPIVEGGAFFYLSWLLENKRTIQTNQEMRDQIQQELERDSDWDTSWNKLKSLDPEYADSLSRNDYRRLGRALEVVRSEGKTMAEIERKIPPTFETRGAYIHCDRLELWEILDRRCERMVERGLLNEVMKNLRYNKEAFLDSVGSTIGYQQAVDFFYLMSKGEEDAIKLFYQFLQNFQVATRQLTRKQVCWIRNTKLPFEMVRLGEKEKNIDELCEIYHKDTAVNTISIEPMSPQDEKRARGYISTPVLFTDHKKVFEVLKNIL